MNEALADAYALLKSGTLWHNTQLASPKHPCKGFADANPGEAALIDAYVAALAAGSVSATPALATATGRGLVGMLAALAPQPPLPPPSPVSTGEWWAGPQPDVAIPPVPPTAQKISTADELKAVCAAGGPSGQFVASGFAYNGNLNVGNRGWPEVWFDASVKIIGPAGSADPAVSMHGRVKFYGGDVSNPKGGSGSSGGDGVKAYVGSSDQAGPDYVWHGLTIHDCAAQGLSSQAARFPINGDVQATISRCGLNTDLDPHTDPGTGLHASYLGGGETATTGRYILVVHDQATGAACQVGAHGQFELWLAARNLTWTADRLAGAAFQPWGAGNSIVVKNLLVDGAQWAVFTESLTGGSVVVEFGRYRNVRLSPAFQTSPHVTFGDFKAG